MSPSSELQHATGVVLRTRPLREADLIVTLLTAEEGKLVGVAPHARRSQRRFGGGMDLGTVVEVGYRRRPGSGLATLEDLRILQAPPAVTADIARFSVFGIILDVVDAMSVEHQAGEGKVAVLRRVLEHTATAPPDGALVHFLIHWWIQTGFAPNMVSCVHCGRTLVAREAARFVPVEGGARCAPCGRPQGWTTPLSPSVRQLWCAEAEGATALLEGGVPPAERPFFRPTLWQYLCHLVDRDLASAPYWDIVWSVR